MKMRSNRSTVTPARPSPLSGISDAGSSEARPAGPRTGTRRMARWSGRVTLLAGLMAALAFPVMAQDGTGPMPLNAQVRSYGTGWICNLGYRVDGADCVALDIPERAYPTGRSYGSGWECDRGYEQVSGISCSDPGAGERLSAGIGLRLGLRARVPPDRQDLRRHRSA